MSVESIKMPNYEDLSTHILLNKEMTNSNTAWYENGILVDVSPRNRDISLYEDRQVAYDSRFIYSDGMKYDLFNPLDIGRIAISGNINSIEAANAINVRIELDNKEDSMVGEKCNLSIGMPEVTKELPYLLQMRVKNTFQKELAIPLVYKAVNMMMASSTSYTKDDYERMVNQLYAVGADNYADHLNNELKKTLPFYEDDDYFLKEAFDKRVGSLYGDGLIEMSYQACACEECAKYMGRIYSVNGSDKRFPKLPQFIIDNKGVHKGCHCTFWSTIYYDGKCIDKYVFDEDGNARLEAVDAIASSNRPFIDNRSEIEKQRYISWVERINKDKSKQSKVIGEKEKWRDSGLKHAEYEWLEDTFPQICPKSISTYTRMKKTQSKKYLELKREALKMGKELIDNFD